MKEYRFERDMDRRMMADYRVEIRGGFWEGRLETNAREAIFHQWEQLEKSGCIDNFRIAAGEAPGFREGLVLRRFGRLQVAGRGFADLAHASGSHPRSANGRFYSPAGAGPGPGRLPFHLQPDPFSRTGAG